MITYEAMKEFVVTFAFDTIVILTGITIIYNIYSAVRRIVRMVKRHKEKKKALDKTIEQA